MRKNIFFPYGVYTSLMNTHSKGIPIKALICLCDQNSAKMRRLRLRE